MKTLGRVSAKLITQLYDEGRTIFAVKDVIRINTASHSTAVKLISDLVKRKVIFRLKRGKYIIIPQELGLMDKFVGNWYVASREIANSRLYYIAYYSAMKHWGMATQPILKTFVVTPKRQYPPRSMADKISFIYVDKKHIWGVNREWATKNEKVRVSNIEKTIVDALFHPEYCGGITEIAKGIWLVKDRIDFIRLLEYVKKYDKNVVSKRLGYILDVLGIVENKVTNELKKFVHARYDLFDPTVKKQNIDKNDWRLIDNIGKEQILRVISY